MEDEDDAQSSPSSASHRRCYVRRTHGDARPSVGATGVNVAATAQQSRSLALPIQQHTRVAGGAGSADRGGGGGGGAGVREDCWSEGATSVLIEAWGERFLELARGNLRQKDWQDVADIVSARDDYDKTPKTDSQCKNRIDTLKKKYKVEKARSSSGAGDPSQWPFFHRLDRLISSNPHNKTPASSSSLPPPPPPKKPKPTNHLPVAVPVAPRSFHHFQKKYARLPNPRSGTISYKAAATAAAAAAAAAPLSPASSDSFAPEAANGKKRKLGREERPAHVRRAHQDGGAGLRELTTAILNFGEVYERVESSKLRQVVEMEKQRMAFTKELELQRMEFFMKTQMELTQLKHNGRAAAAAAAAVAAQNNSNSDNTD